MTHQAEKPSLTHKILTMVGIVMCVILIPILIVNCTLLIKGYANAEAVPTFGGFAPMIVLTGSMEPVFRDGDLIFIRTAEPEEIQTGDIVSFFDPAGSGTAVVTHRVQKVIAEDGEILFITKGDANNAEDRLAVRGHSIIGTYTGLRIPGAGNVAMFMQTTAGLIVCVVLPTFLLIGYDILRRRSYDRQYAQDKDALMAELEELRKLKAEKELGSRSEE